MAATKPPFEFMFVDVGSLLQHSLSTFTLDSSGAATQVGSTMSPFPGNIVVSEHGFLYASDTNKTTISEYRINSDGSLTSEGSVTTPLPIGSYAPVTLDDTGFFAYALLYNNTTGAETIEQYTVDPTTGVLTDIGSVSANNPSTGNCALGFSLFSTLLADPNLSTLYAAGFDCSIAEFSIDSTAGSLSDLGITTLPNDSFPTDPGPIIVPAAEAVFVQSLEQVGNYGIEQILPFAINTTAGATFGTLTEQTSVTVEPEAPFQAEGPLAALSDGTFLLTPTATGTVQLCSNLSGPYGTCSDDLPQSSTETSSVQSFKIGPDASLSNVSTTPVETATQTATCPTSVLMQDPTSLACSYAGTTPLSGPVLTGSGVGPLFVDNSNQFLFYADPGTSSVQSSLIEYQINSATGQLGRIAQLLPGVPVDYGGFSAPSIGFYSPEGQATLKSNPSFVTFKGTITVGSASKPHTVKLEAPKSNTQSIAIFGLTWGGTTNPKDFTVVLGPNNQTPCVGDVLAPGQNCKFKVEFTPQEAGAPLTGTITVRSNAVKYPTINIPLTGTAQ